MVQLSESDGAKIENALVKGADALADSNPDIAQELVAAQAILTKLLDEEANAPKEGGGGAPPFG